MKFKILCVSFLAGFLCLILMAGDLDFVRAYFYNQKFKYLMSAQKFTDAQRAILNARENFETPFFDNNLGVSFETLQKPDQALKSFGEAFKNIEEQFLPDSAQKKRALFEVYFNLGVHYGSAKKMDEALDSYQRALDIVPTSNEVKTNIELLIQKNKQEQKDQEQKDQKGQQPPQAQEPNKDGKEDPKQGKDKSGEPDPKEAKNNDDEKDKGDQKDQDRAAGKKYEPRPFKGEQLSEGDVKKILGELAQQDKKIRAQFDKFDKKGQDKARKDGKNEKDW